MLTLVNVGIAVVPVENLKRRRDNLINECSSFEEVINKTVQEEPWILDHVSTNLHK